MLKLPASLDISTVEGNTNRENYPLLSEALLTAYLVHCQYPPEIKQNLDEIQDLYLVRIISMYNILLSFQ